VEPPFGGLDDRSAHLLAPTALTLDRGYDGCWLTVNYQVAVGALVTATENGRLPAAKGEPLTGVSAPVARSIAYPETVLSPKFATQANLLVGFTAMEVGKIPAAKGEPAIGVSAPVAGSIMHPKTVLPPEFAT
jgi:hypothetical protein